MQTRLHLIRYAYIFVLYKTKKLVFGLNHLIINTSCVVIFYAIFSLGSVIHLTVINSLKFSLFKSLLKKLIYMS